MESQLEVVSVCRSLPSPVNPSDGIFVFNRLAALARQARVSLLQPVPWCPVVAPLPAWAREPAHRVQEQTIEHAPMFYLPKILKSLDPFWLDRAIAGSVARKHAARPIDVLDAHFGHPEGVACVRIARRLRIPVFITIRGFENEYVDKPVIGPMLVRAMREATGCIAVSHSLRELAIRCGVEPGKVRVVHNAIDRSVFRVRDRVACRAALGIAQQSRVVVSIGHLTARKRHHVLIDAFARTRREHPAATLVVIGGKVFEPQYPQQLADQVRRLGIESAVRFEGNLPPAKVATWLAAADAFALGTAREGCCNAVLEALACGLPVVTTPVGDNAYFVKDGDNGYLSPVDDAAAMATALTRTLQRSWDPAGISKRLAVGTWDDVAAQVLEFFRAGRSPVHSASNRIELPGAGQCGSV